MNDIDLENKQAAAQLRKPNGKEGVETSLRMNESNAKITEATIHALTLNKDETVIEIGPGNGLLSLPLFDLIGANGQYIAIDYSEDMIKATQENLIKAGIKNFQVIHENCQTITQIPKANAIFAVNVLYFIDDLYSFFMKIRHWLKPNARIAFGVRTKESMELLPFTKYNFNKREESEYFTALEKSGFSQIAINKHDKGYINFKGNDIKNEFLVITGLV